MSGYLISSGVHAPACDGLDAHISAAVAESQGFPETLDSFVARVRADWQEEQMIADAGDEAVIRYWAAVDADFQLRFAS